MEDKTIEDCRQQKPMSSPHSTTIMESALVDPPSTQPVNRQQPADEAEYESTNIQHVDAHESESKDESAEETKSKPVAEGRRYLLRQRKASSRYPTNKYVLLTDEEEPERYEEAMNYVPCKRKWIPCMRTTPLG